MDNIQKAKNGDADAFIALMESYMQSMYKIARSILKSNEDVADAIQETILSCWEKITQLKEKRKMDFISNDIIGIMAGYVILEL